MGIGAVVAVACTRAPERRGDTATVARSDSSRAPVRDSGASAATNSQAAPKTPPARPADPNANPSTTVPTVLPSENVMTGTIAVGGVAADQLTTLRVEGGSPVTLVGPLARELATLGGATVWVAGAPGPGRPNATFTVSRYEIVSIAGAKPFVGHVLARGNQAVLALERDTLTLLSAPAALTSKTGAKVWVVGRREGGDLTPQTYGVIREP